MFNRLSPGLTRKLSSTVLIGLLVLICADTTLAADKKKGKKDEAESAAMDEKKSTALYRCEADVFYVWKRTPRLKTKIDTMGKTVPDEPPLDAELLKPIEVFFSRPGETAESEAVAGHKLDAQLPQVLSEARALCERRHQSESRCVLARMKAVGKDYRMLDFQARKQFLDTVSEDCRLSVGVCMDAKVGKTECEAKAMNSAATPDGQAEETGKESKKKKK
ncbi:MAG: hypothetical protein KDD66_09105 [Bdellovibrionales bacterium]|nr:hypothetical protein [Bdellovibrionales bacterium]